MITIVKILGYIFASYGFANMIVYSNGPFHIFERWRSFAHSIHEQFGELFTCMLCISTWIGLVLSLINILLLPNLPFTPFNIIIGTQSAILTVLLDMGFTSGIVWVLHQLEEMMERIGVYNDEEDGE